jgi:hypothetical protein
MAMVEAASDRSPLMRTGRIEPERPRGGLRSRSQVSNREAQVPREPGGRQEKRAFGMA